MNRDLRSQRVDYAALDRLRWSDIEFVSMPTDGIGPVIRNGDRAVNQKRGYDSWRFLDQVFALLSANGLSANGLSTDDLLDSGPESLAHLILISRLEQEQLECYGFAYFRDLKILPIRFNLAENFEAWVKALTEKLSQTQPAVFRLHATGMSIFSGDGPGLVAKTGDFLTAQAPKLYRQLYRHAEEQTVKQAYLDQSKALDSMQQSVDLAETEALWKALISMTPSLNDARRYSEPPDFDNFKAETGLEFPAELQVIYRLTNGVPDDFMGPKLLPLEKVIAEWKNWKTIFDDWSLDELRGHSESHGEKTLGMYTNPYWIPLIDNVSGNFIAMDLMPGKTGKVGQMIKFGADTDLIICEADNINDFLFSKAGLSKS